MRGSALRAGWFCVSGSTKFARTLIQWFGAFKNWQKTVDTLSLSGSSGSVFVG